MTLKQENTQNVVEVERVSDSIMQVKLEIEDVMTKFVGR